VIEPREELLGGATEAARGLAEALLALAIRAPPPVRAGAGSRSSGAMHALRLCIAAYEAAGDPQSAARTRERQRARSRSSSL